MSETLSRRQFLVVGGSALLTACTSSSDDQVAPATSTISTTTTSSTVAPTTAAITPTGLQAAAFDQLPVCQLAPAMGTGPFDLEEQFLRADISEGYPGHPLRLGLRVVDDGCVPVSDVEVEVWHADSTGDYSAYVDNGSGKDEGEGTTFLRGTQPVDGDGIVEFRTLYPGWYPGRAPHIHVNVRSEGSVLFTTQLFFADEYSAEIYRTGTYADNGRPDTTNASDGLAGRLDTLPLLHTTPDGDGTTALLNLGLPL